MLKWWMKFNVNKYKVMHMGEKYREIKCKMQGTRLLSLVNKILGL